MATSIADVQVRIGTEISQFQRGLRQAERELQRSADKFNQLGNNLSLAVSVPLAGIGIGALKAAGDVESLRLGFEATMTGAGKSTAEATAELLKLQKAAEAPGLDFEQAVKGSIRLQNVGFEAEQSRKILSELANAISLTGGNAEQLDGVTKQFAQMAGKGRILQEDLSILVENMPVLSKVLKDTFGTANAEGLRKLGISTEEFILKTTEGLAKLERVPGGLNNAFTNAGVSIKLALANVGESLNKALNVTGNLEAFSTWITDLAAGFASLDEGTQKLAFGFGAAALAAGPLFKLIGGGIEVFSTARSAALSMGKALEVSKTAYAALAPELGGVTAGLRSASLAWKALDTTAKATVIGAALAVVVALGAAFYTLAESTTDAARAQAAVNEVSLQAEKNIAAERVEAEQLVGILKSSTASYEEKRAALARLNQISPEYFGGLNLEKSSLEQINNAYTRYIDNLLTAARAQAAQSKIVELEKQRLDLADQLAKQQERVKNAGGFGVFFETGGGGGSITSSLQSQIKSIETQQKALADVAIKANAENAKLQTNAVAVAGAPIGAGGLSAGAPLPTGKAPAKKTDPIRSGLPGAFSFGDVEGFQIITDGVNQYSEALERLAEANNPVVESQALLVSQNEALAEFSDKATISLYDQAAAVENLQRQMDLATRLGLAMGEAIIQTSEDGKASLSDYAKAVGNAARKTISAFIAEGVTAAASRALAGAPFPANLILAPIAGAAAAALFNSVIPKFAEGGIVTGPTYGLIGEAGPEVIFPLSDLKKFVADNGGGGRIQVYGRLSGNDILLSSERSDGRRKDVRGY